MFKKKAATADPTPAAKASANAASLTAANTTATSRSNSVRSAKPVIIPERSSGPAVLIARDNNRASANDPVVVVNVEMRAGFDANDAIERLLMGADPVVVPSKSSTPVEPASAQQTVTRQTSMPMDDGTTDIEAGEATTSTEMKPSMPFIPPAGVFNYFKAQCKLSLTDFDLLSVIGEGQFGKVFLANVKKTKKLVALKCVDKELCLEDQTTMSEKETMELFSGKRHPFIMNMLGCFQTSTYVIMVLEYACAGDLVDALRSQGAFKEPAARFYLTELVLALGFLHDHGIVHRDVKIDNILVMKDGHTKLSDFGLSKALPGGDKNLKMKTFCGTLEYVAPEMVKIGTYNRAVDWWSAGVVLYTLVIGETPYGNGNDVYVRENIGKVRMDPVKKQTAQFKSVIQDLLNPDPASRLGGSLEDWMSVQKHEFFKGVDWDAAMAKKSKPPYVPKLKKETDVSHFLESATEQKAVLEDADETLPDEEQRKFQAFDAVYHPEIFGL